VINVDGQVVKNYGNQPGSAAGQLNFPFCIAATKEGCILVADHNNDRIVVLNSLLKVCRELPLPVDGGVQRPLSVCLDESRGRLYVGENGGQFRVLVFDDVPAFPPCSKPSP
jgi:hypothetical protein